MSSSLLHNAAAGHLHPLAALLVKDLQLPRRVCERKIVWRPPMLRVWSEKIHMNVQLQDNTAPIVYSDTIEEFGKVSQ